MGTVWTVGGLAPFSTGIPNGRGGLLGSGTNAPLYTTQFTNARPKAQEDIENHESRLAEALEIDRSTRVFEFRNHSMSPPKIVELDQSNSFEVDRKTVWNGTEWVLSTPDQSTLTSPLHLLTLEANITQRYQSLRSRALFLWHPSSKFLQSDKRPRSNST